MIILIRLRNVIITLLIITILISCGVGIYLWVFSTKTTVKLIDEDIKQILTIEMQKIIDLRNKALLDENIDVLASLYNQNLQSAVWAYEEELIKMKALHSWSAKQAITFKEINSHVVIRNIRDKEYKYSLNLLVSTEYQYVYKDNPKTYNSFRLGTYHALDLMQEDNEKWFITKEWYTDPLADSLHLDDIKSQEIQEIILSGSPNNLSNLHEKRIAAVEYADKYAGAASLPEYGFKYNPQYRDYNPLGGDCANYASQMLYETGVFTKNRTWNYERGAGSKSWINADAFNNYMIYSGRASVIAHGTYTDVLESSYQLLPGDYIAYEKKGKVTHISVVTGMDSKGYILVNSHNSDRYRVPWDLGWSNEGIKFWLVKINY